MPVFLEPNIVFPIVLDCDKDKPPETRPTFFAKSQSMRGQTEIASRLDELTDRNKTLAELFSDTVDEAMKVITGWENMGGYEFSKDSMIEVLTYSEVRELIRKVMSNQHVKPEEKKDSE
jgi:hypothetical protein